MQEALADLVESFVTTHTPTDSFTPEEIEELARIALRPFKAADPAEVTAPLARHGQG